ncbi:MAG: UDP-N-acetylmuramoyl-L-alanine--D-glutamate ligase [Melioribacter sp.]|uniref:UDP-N-acetylmuramoyl-L-alanine--D-glutamate ligase n=1 Tax=Rosettibacter primus TaxID=3111523 RepID=UPI00247EB0DC|nr:UDP-N-acetylmuramoyl-L-alanine--D-glutamate ligase [Melioribacter sp.]
MMDIKNKKISIVGAVRSGIAAALLAKKLGAIPFVSDSASKDKLQKSIEIFQSEGIDFEYGAHSERVYNCDFIITSPGVPSDSEVLSNAIKKGIKIISEIEFASWFCKGTIISITGTNGKTTTTSLMNHTLNECGLKSYSAGNIGNAFSEIVLDINENEFVSLETSSFQLDFIESFKPRFSVILNITPDHLDRYNNNFDEYIASKFKIIKNQDESDFFIYNADDSIISNKLTNIRAHKIGFSLTQQLNVGTYFNDGKLFFAWYGKHEEICKSADLFIKGEHNIANALAVLAIAKILNLPNKKIRSAFASFKGVEHRIEFVRELDGVEYYNDSKATNVDSVWYALKSFDKPIYLILGGKDKGNNYDKIRELVIQKVRKIYAIGSSANKIYDYFKDIVPTEYKQTIESCVDAARIEAEPGSVVLLSPACASFDMFDNYEHRGKVFKNAVSKLK